MVTLLGCGDAAAAGGDGMAADGVEHAGGGPDAAVDAGGYAFPCSEPWEATGEATLESIYFEVFCAHGCTSGPCHGAWADEGGLDLATLAQARAELVDVPAGDGEGLGVCADTGLVRVAPGDPEASLLLLKVEGRADCGTVMPPPDAGREALDADEIERLRAWIAAGAE